MEIIEIIKNSLVYPSNDLAKLAIYIVIYVAIALLSVGGTLLVTFSFMDASYLAVVGVILTVVGIILSFILSGYQISILKTGIDKSDAAPDFEWKNDLVTGIKLLIVDIVYFIIPAIIVLIIGFITNIPGNFMKIFQSAALSPANATNMVNSTAGAVPQSVVSSLLGSLVITGIVALVLFIIFLLAETMAESRLANTGSLMKALNIPEAFKDISRIGVGKVIAVILLVFIIIAVVNGIIGFISSRIPAIYIISLIVTPYLIFFAKRAAGLLYSDIA